ncbi:unnamed protein product [Notodromas monacha]|uniref:Uncharacterized protein n=1 Tax=Notodromas monacha TaxID=399045 RepID=A0A7R9BUY3_9CRUS|nr:unnamed protein product [Notodromas monacha]CAG0922225.1 unnamed protein product [Notodromas monacha]
MGKRKDQAKAVASEEANLEGNGGGDVPLKKGKAAGGKKGALVAEPDSTVGDEASKSSSKGKKAKPVLAEERKDQEDVVDQDLDDVAPDSVAAIDPEEAASRPKKGRQKNGAAVVEEKTNQKPGKEKPNKRAALKTDDASLTDLSPVKKPAGKGSRPKKIVEDASSTEEVTEPAEGRRPKRNAAAAAAVAMAEGALAEKQFESKRKKKGDLEEGKKQAPKEKKSRAKKNAAPATAEEEEEEHIEEDDGEVKASVAEDEEEEEKPVVPVKGKSAGKKNKVAPGKNKKPADEEDEQDEVAEAQDEEVEAGNKPGAKRGRQKKAK